MIQYIGGVPYEMDFSEKKKEADFIATIGTVYNDGVTLIINGVETEKHYKRNASATFASGDRVKCVRISGTILVEYPIN